MGSLSIWHWLIVLLVVVLIFGTKKLRNMGGDVGGAIKEFKSSMADAKTSSDTNAPTSAALTDTTVAVPTTDSAKPKTPVKRKAPAKTASAKPAATKTTAAKKPATKKAVVTKPVATKPASTKPAATKVATATKKPATKAAPKPKASA